MLFSLLCNEQHQPDIIHIVLEFNKKLNKLSKKLSKH